MRPLAITLCVSLAGFSQSTVNFQIDSVAGRDALAIGGQAASSVLEDVRSAAVDSNGNIYFSDTARHRVLRIDANGVIRAVAGNGVAGLGQEGVPATTTPLNQPYGIAVDSAGNVYIADLGNARVRKVATDGLIQTIAGGGLTKLTSSPAVATQVELKAPRNVAVDASGNVYVSDFLDHRVLRIANGQIQAAAGTGTAGANVDSVPATLGMLSYPAGLYADATGLYIADSGNHAIRKLAYGVLTTLRFQDASGFLNLPTGVCGDSAGNLFIASSGFGQVLRVNRAGAVTVVAQGAKDVAVNQAGDLYMASGETLRKLSASGLLTTVAGGVRSLGAEGIPANQALLNSPTDVKADTNGVLLVADTKNHRIRKIQNGAITTIAGTAESGYSGDRGPALQAKLASPQGVAVDRLGNVYIADTGNHAVRKITLDGQIATVAGTGSSGSNGDVKLGVEAQLNGPVAVAVDAMGQVHVADTGNHRIRRLLASGYLVTIAGTGQAGNGAAQLDSPRGLAFDAVGNLFVIDSGNKRIRKITPGGTMTTVAVGLTNPFGIAVDSSGALLVTDDQRVKTIGADGVAQTAAGTGNHGFSGDGGAALQADLDEPSGITIANDGAVYFADRQNHRIRKLLRGAAPPPAAVEKPPDVKVLHAATLETTAIAPGMLLSIQGTGVGPANAQSGQPGANGQLETSVGGTEVRFDGRPAPILYAQSNLINTQAPYRIATQPLVLVEVVRDGKVMGSAVLEVVAAAPGIFTSGGSGQVTAVNDDYTLNGLGNGAVRGSLVTFYATGEGVTDPAAVDGKLSETPYPAPKAPVEVSIAGQAAEIVTMGSGITSPGVLQLTVRVPAQANIGTQPVVLKVGGAASQRNATIVVK